VRMHPGGEGAVKADGGRDARPTGPTGLQAVVLGLAKAEDAKESG
jgi:hypothetical protein